MNDTNELLEELEDMRDELAQSIARIEQVEMELPSGPMRERLRQVRAQFEIALGQDHDWLGGSSYTLESSIDEIRTAFGEQDDAVCEWCGEPANEEQGSVSMHVVSPPVDGYSFEEGLYHTDCAATYAERSIR